MLHECRHLVVYAVIFMAPEIDKPPRRRLKVSPN